MNYIHKHWDGDYSLRISFWFSFLALTMAYYYVEKLIRVSFHNHPRALILTVIIHLVISRLIIYPWQVIGLLRACGRHLLTHGHVIRVRAVQAVVILSLLGTFIHILETTQRAWLIVSSMKFNHGRPQIRNKGENHEQDCPSIPHHHHS